MRSGDESGHHLVANLMIVNLTMLCGFVKSGVSAMKLVAWLS